MSALQPLIARDVSKAYADRVVLTGIDLVATPGQPLGLVGENGAGKSTLIRLLVGAEAADGGTVVRPTDLGYVSQELDLPLSPGRLPTCSLTRWRRRTRQYVDWSR